MAYKSESDLYNVTSIVWDRDSDEAVSILDMIASNDVDGETSMLLEEALEAGYDSLEQYMAAP